MTLSPGVSSVLIATLGTEAQVVSTALDLLLGMGEQIQRVIVVHTGGKDTPLDEPVKVLRQAFESPGVTLRLELVPILDARGRLLPDVDTPGAAESAWRALYHTVQQAKQAGEKVHLSIAGGRKTLALYGMLTAQLLFDDDDRLWYLFSRGAYLAEKRLHPGPGDETALVPIPVVRWSSVSPVLLDVGRFEDPFQALQRQEDLRLAQRLEEAHAFVRGSLTAAEARVVALLVREGLSDAEIAQRLVLSTRTVSEHLGAAYRKAAAHWEMANIDRTQLVQLLYFYFLDPERGNP